MVYPIIYPIIYLMIYPDLQRLIVIVCNSYELVQDSSTVSWGILCLPMSILFVRRGDDVYRFIFLGRYSQSLSWALGASSTSQDLTWLVFFSTKLKRCYIATFGSDPILMTFLGVENRWTCLNCFFSQFSHCQLRFKQTVYILYIVDCFVSWLIIMFVHLTWTLLSCLRMLKSHFPS